MRSISFCRVLDPPAPCGTHPVSPHATTRPTPTTSGEAKILSGSSGKTGSIQNFKDDRSLNGSLFQIFLRLCRISFRSAAAAVGVGGAYGQAEVFERGKCIIGHADLSQANISASLGGQRYAEIIFFQDEGRLATFKTNQVQVRRPGLRDRCLEGRRHFRRLSERRGGLHTSGRRPDVPGGHRRAEIPLYAPGR